MATSTVTTYGPGGFDPAAPDRNVVEESTVEVPEDADAAARAAFRDAVSKATSLAQLKDAILGTTTGAEPDVRPSR